MDSLIGILVLIGIFAASSKKKKKAQAKSPRRQAAPQPSRRQAGQKTIPFTREEWNSFLADMQKQQETAEARPAKPSAKPKAVAVSAPVSLLEHDEPEGTVSTQGESAAEHAEHRRKILAEEAQLQEQQDSLQELRHMNLKKLRSAVVMSEVLGKPVSLRPRGYR